MGAWLWRVKDKAGKRKQLTHKAWQTISPWNNRTEREIREELKVECVERLASARRLLAEKALLGNILELTEEEVMHEIQKRNVGA